MNATAAKLKRAMLLFAGVLFIVLGLQRHDDLLFVCLGAGLVSILRSQFVTGKEL